VKTNQIPGVNGKQSFTHATRMHAASLPLRLYQNYRYGTIASTPIQIAETFNAYFSNVATNSASNFSEVNCASCKEHAA